MTTDRSDLRRDILRGAAFDWMAATWRRTDRLFSELATEYRNAPERPVPVARPTRSYLMCFVNRSGSNLLAAALTSTRVLGVPVEPFSFPDIERVARVWQARTLREFALRVIDTGTTSNGVFGVKLSAAQLFHLARERVLADLLADPLYVLVTRRDTVAQAVSFTIADQTGRWTSDGSSGVEPTYDPVAISKALHWIAQSQSAFETYFAMMDIQPLRLVYEDFVDGIDNAVASIAAALGVVEPVVVRPEGIKTLRQATSLNYQFRRRFLEDAAGRQ